MVQQKKAVVTKYLPLTADSVEIQFTFTDDTSLEYIPGQFIQIMIPDPKEDQDWFIVTKQKVWAYIHEHGPVHFSILGEYFTTTSEHLQLLLQQLEQEGAIEIENDHWKSLVSERNPDRVTPFMRPYSLGSSPLQSYCSTMIKEVEGGFFSKYVVGLGRLREGDEIIVTGPMGHFMLPAELPSHLLLIAAGSGITPCMSMIRHLHLLGASSSIVLLYSNKREEDIIYREELAKLEEQYPLLSVIHTLTRVEEHEQWGGRKGRIDAALLQEYLHSSSSLAYICGPLVFARSMKSLLEEECGVAKECIKIEAYG